VAGTPLYGEILVDLGALDVLVGVTDSPDNPPELDDVLKIGPSFPGPNIELIIALEPDVVLGAVFDVRDQLEAAGLVVVTPVAFIAGISDLFKVIETVGAVVDREGAASAVVQEDPVRAAFLFPSGDGPPYAAGKGSIEGELLTRAGGLNVFADVAGGNVVSLEELIARDPQVIFTDLSQVDLITDNALLSGVSAVKNARVFGLKASSLTSTRVADALKSMALALHPGAFSGSAD
jgi:iron complex transport system substrate-binding protein